MFFDNRKACFDFLFHIDHERLEGFRSVVEQFCLPSLLRVGSAFGKVTEEMSERGLKMSDKTIR